MAACDTDVDFPNEIQDCLENFHDSLKGLEETLSPLLNANMSELEENLSPLEKAKLHLTTTYALNALFWMYLNTIGEDPKQHAIKQELDRIKNYMNRAKEIEDKEKAPKLVIDAAKRFLRSSLWEPNSDKDNAQNAVTRPKTEGGEENGWIWESMTPVAPNSAHALVQEWEQNMSDDEQHRNVTDYVKEENRKSCMFEKDMSDEKKSLKNLQISDDEVSEVSFSTSTPLKIDIKVEPTNNLSLCKMEADEKPVEKKRRRRR